MRSTHVLLALFAATLGYQDRAECRGSRPGDCDPLTCGGSCEARYIRFYDKATQSDRTLKTCQCIEDKTCSIIGMHAYSGCRSYMMLSTQAQRLIRLWSMNWRDRQSRNSNNPAKRYNDKRRHHQLLNGNSRFCCNTASPVKSRPLRWRSNNRNLSYPMATLSAMIFFFVFL